MKECNRVYELFCSSKNSLIVSLFNRRDKMIRIWTVKYDEDGESTQIFQEMNYNPLEGHKYGVNFVEISPCGSKLASCSMDGNTIIWDIEVSIKHSSLLLQPPNFLV